MVLFSVFIYYIVIPYAVAWLVDVFYFKTKKQVVYVLYLTLGIIVFLSSLSGQMAKFYLYVILYGVGVVIASPFVLYLIFSLIGGSGYGK